MFNVQHTDSIKVIREWLDDISYSSLNWRIMQFLDQTGHLYPDFTKCMVNIDRINPLYAFIFSVFRLGQPTERSFLDDCLPAKVIDALIETGLLLYKGKYYQMPEVGILPLGGMYFVTGLPEVYPTVSRNSRFKPIDNSLQMIMDAITSQPIGKDFLELHSDYGILANMAVAKGFKNIQIQPKNPNCIPLIKLNLALNYHNSEMVTDRITNEYDLIACAYFSVKEKTERRNQEIVKEKDVIKLIPVFRQLKEKGNAIVLLESVGTIREIAINTRIKEMAGVNIQSVVLDKIPHSAFLHANYLQSFWEKQLELVPQEYEDYAQKTIKSSEDKVIIFSQLLKISKGKNDEAFALYPLYNPKYTDPVFNLASITV